jgi:alpha-1,3-glucosyltransferase
MLSTALDALEYKGTAWVVPCLLGFALFVRLAVSTHPYSGEHTPPMYGDFEVGAHTRPLLSST